MATKKNFNDKYFRVSLFLGYDENGKRKYKYFYGDGKKDAELKRDRYKLNQAMGQSEDNPLLQKAMHDWLFTVIKPTGVKDSTFSRYYDHYTAIIKTELAMMKIKDIHTDHLQQCYNSLASTKTYDQIELINKILRRHFKYLISCRKIIFNPTDGITLPKSAIEKHKDQTFMYDPYSKVEKEMLLRYLKVNYRTYYLITAILFKLGPREGEIFGLCLNDINFKARTLNISSSLLWVRTVNKDGSVTYSYQNETAKNRSSVRTIYFDDEVETLLQEALVIRAKNKLKAGPAYNTNFNLVFAYESGNPISGRSYLAYIQRVQAKLGFPKKTVHCIRHTFVTECFEKGIDEMTVQAIIGHTKGSNITRDVYTHLRKENLKEKMLEAIK